MSNGSGVNTSGTNAPAPAAYAPISPPVKGQMNPSPLQGLDASAIQTNGQDNPFALGGRIPGDYVPQQQAQPAPTRAPMPAQAPNGGFPATPATPIAAPPSAAPRAFMGGVMNGINVGMPQRGYIPPNGGMGMRGSNR